MTTVSESWDGGTGVAGPRSDGCDHVVACRSWGQTCCLPHVTADECDVTCVPPLMCHSVSDDASDDVSLSEGPPAADSRALARIRSSRDLDGKWRPALHVCPSVKTWTSNREVGVTCEWHYDSVHLYVIHDCQVSCSAQLSHVTGYLIPSLPTSPMMLIASFSRATTILDLEWNVGMHMPKTQMWNKILEKPLGHWHQ